MKHKGRVNLKETVIFFVVMEQVIRWSKRGNKDELYRNFNPDTTLFCHFNFFRTEYKTKTVTQITQ